MLETINEQADKGRSNLGDLDGTPIFACGYAMLLVTLRYCLSLWIAQEHDSLMGIYVGDQFCRFQASLFDGRQLSIDKTLVPVQSRDIGPLEVLSRRWPFFHWISE